METINLLSELRKNGFSVRAENSRLQITPAKKLTNELKQTIKQNKTEILCALHHEEELKRVINLICDARKIPDDEREYEIERAVSDQITAMTCWVSLARIYGIEL